MLPNGKSQLASIIPEASAKRKRGLLLDDPFDLTTI